MNLFDAIFEARPVPSAALHFDGRQITYGDLRDETLRASQMFQQLLVKRGDRVALLLHDSPEFIATFISLCSNGAIAVPINMALGIENQRAILNDCGACLAVIEPELCSNLLEKAGQLPFLKTVVIRTEDTQQSFKKLSEATGLECHVLSTLMRRNEETQTERFPEPDPEQPAFILYTSGSTGEPKGAVHRQADIFYTNETFCHEVLRLTANDRLFSSSRLPFAYGLGNGFSFPLLNGASSILCREKPTPDIISRIFHELRPTIFFGVPVVYKLLLEHHLRTKKLDCTSLRLCVSAGEALPAKLGEDWQNTFGVEVLDGIGSTEMLHMFMSNHAGSLRYGSSGTVLGGYEAQLRDENAQPSAPDREGNLWIKGASAALGYWERPEETARTFVNGWVRTGDLYRRDADGYWFHMGRSDDCFKSSGQWVSPIEVEGVLLRHNYVSRAAVVEGFDTTGLPSPCAFIVAEGSMMDTATLQKELEQLAAESLPRFKRPQQYRFVSELPYTATGKVQRFKLRTAAKLTIAD